MGRWYRETGKLENNRYVERGYYENDTLLVPCKTRDLCLSMLAEAKRYHDEKVKGTSMNGHRTIESTVTCLQNTYYISKYCPYIFDVLRDDKAFRENLASILKESSIPITTWLIEGGVTSGFHLIHGNGKTYLRTSNGQPHNSGHRINMLLEIGSRASGGNRLVAAYFPDDGAERRWLNAPSDEEISIMEAAEKGNGRQSKDLELVRK